MNNRAYPVYELENHTTGELWNCEDECSPFIQTMVDEAKEHGNLFRLVLYKLTEKQHKYFIEHHTIPDYAVGTVLDCSPH